MSSTNPDIYVIYLLILFWFIEHQPKDVSTTISIIGLLMNVHSFLADLLPWTAPCMGCRSWEYFSFDDSRVVWIWYCVHFSVLALNLQLFLGLPSLLLFSDTWLAIIQSQYVIASFCWLASGSWFILVVSMIHLLR